MRANPYGPIRLVAGLLLVIGVTTAHADPPAGKPDDSDAGFADDALPPSQPEKKPEISTGYKLAPKAEGHRPHFWLLYFQLGDMVAVRSQGSGYSVSPWVSWNPTFPITDTFQLRGNVELSLLKTATGQYFSATDFEALFSLAADGGYLELGGGIQNWSQNGGSHPVFSANIAAPFPHDIWGFLDRFVLGYSAYLATPYVHEARIGLGVAF